MQGSPIPPTSLTPAQIAAAGGLLAANNLSDVVSAAASRTSLGLGTAATAAASSFLAVANNLSDVAVAATALANIAGYPLHLTVNAQTGTTYTLVAADDGKLISLSNALGITLTVPTNASVPMAVGAQILLVQIGAGQLTVAAAGGVTVNASPGLKLVGQWRYATLIKRVASDTWDLAGALSA